MLFYSVISSVPLMRMRSCVCACVRVCPFRLSIHARECVSGCVCRGALFFLSFLSSHCHLGILFCDHGLRCSPKLVRVKKRIKQDLFCFHQVGASPLSICANKGTVFSMKLPSFQVPYLLAYKPTSHVSRPSKSALKWPVFVKPAYKPTVNLSNFNPHF